MNEGSKAEKLEDANLMAGRESSPADSVHERFMAIALAEAAAARDADEVPVGAVVCLDNRVVARAHNNVIASRDPTAHAEIIALRRAADRIGNYRLSGMTLYSTLEPCIMCAGAILQARISRLVFGALDPKAGAVRSLYSLLNDERLNHSLDIVEGICSEECSEILSGFFRQKRISSLPRFDDDR